MGRDVYPPRPASQAVISRSRPGHFSKKLESGVSADAAFADEHALARHELVLGASGWRRSAARPESGAGHASRLLRLPELLTHATAACPTTHSTPRCRPKVGACRTRALPATNGLRLMETRPLRSTRRQACTRRAMSLQRTGRRSPAPIQAVACDRSWRAWSRSRSRGASPNGSTMSSHPAGVVPPLACIGRWLAPSTQR